MPAQLCPLPLVSVYIPTHNRVESLKRAIDSVFAQSYWPIEVCICDDGSTDSTFEFCEGLVRFNDNVKFTRNDVARGACYARNAAISLASGKFLTGLDDDDEFLPSRIKIFMDCWNDNYSFLCDNFFNVQAGCATRHYRRGGIFSLAALKLNNEAGNQVFTLTERVQSVGGFSVGLLKLQDWDLWLRLCARYGNFHRLNHCSYKMNHGHLDRVSNNVAYSEALDSLLHNNDDIYTMDDIYLIRRYIVQKCRLPDVISERAYFSDKIKRNFILRKLLKNILGG